MAKSKKPVKKVTKAKASTASAKSAGSAAVPVATAASKQWTLDELVTEVGAAPADERALLVDAISVDVRVGLGTEYATTDILFSLPDFVGTALASWRSLSAAQKANSAFLGMSDDVLAVLVGETAGLRDLQRQFLVASPPAAATKRDRFRVVKSNGVGLRDSVLRALRARVPASSENADVRTLRASIDEGAGTAETGEPLAKGLESVAKMVRDARTTLGDDWSERADTVGLTVDLPATLESTATAVRDSEAGAQTGAQGKRIDQRTLDLQDGVVCALVQSIYRMFSDAAAVDASIVVPPLGRLRRLGGHRTESAPAQPATKTATASSGNGAAATQ